MTDAYGSQTDGGVIRRMVLFGASGDLSGRFLLPGLATLLDQGLLPEPFLLMGAAGQDWSDDGFRAFASSRLDEHAADVSRAAREKFVASLRYRPTDAADVAATEATLRVVGGAEPIAVYLALPPKLYGEAIQTLTRAGLPDGSRVVLEKPFGEDLRSARALNALVEDAIPGDREAIFRVDHVLGMATTQNLVALRATDPVLGALWSSEHIEEVAILWEETLALEGRAGFYDQAGAVKDVLQNHMLQVLALVLMEPPRSLDPSEVRARKVEALRAVRPFDVDRADSVSRRARYTAGRLGGTAERDVPSYVHEDGVDPARETETFAELLLEASTPRWSGTRFRLRAGKALDERRKGVYVRFRPTGSNGDEPLPTDGLEIGLDTPEEVVVRLNGTSLIELASPPIRSRLPAYAAVLRDVLAGGSGLSVSGEEAEEAWRIVDPVLTAWREGRVPMHEYPAGSMGPPRL